MHELGKKIINPLIFDDSAWTNEWITEIEDRFWSAVNIASGASKHLKDALFQEKLKKVVN